MNSLCRGLLRASFLTAVFSAPAVHAALYWDMNGNLAGAGTPADGTWNTGSYWSASSAGEEATAGWIDGQDVVFSAGTEEAGTWNITIEEGTTVRTQSILFNGAANTIHNISGGTIDMGSEGLVIDASAAGSAGGRGKTIASALTGSGGVVVAANGDTSASGGGSNSYLALTGANSFTGDVTITSGVLAAQSVFGAGVEDRILLDGGGLVDPNLNVALEHDIVVTENGGVLRNYGNVSDFQLNGALSGAGTLRRTDGGVTKLNGDGSGFTGQLWVERGTMQIGSGTQTGDLLPNASAIVLGDATAGGTLRYQLDGSLSLSALPPITFANNGSVLEWRGTGAEDLLTVDQAFGDSFSFARLAVTAGGISLVDGAEVQFREISLGSTPSNSAEAVVGTLHIGEGASLEAQYLNIGNGSGQSGIIQQTGGTVTLASGGNGIRIGHWNNGTATPPSEYRLVGGTLDASALAAHSGAAGVVNIGWDGQGLMTVGGGSQPALLLAPGVQVDANGDNAAEGVGEMSLTLSPNGTVELGSRGTGSASASDVIRLNGGVLRGTAAATWAAAMNAESGTTSVIDLPQGFKTVFSGSLAGDGTVEITGEGIWESRGDTFDFAGTLHQRSGIFSGQGSVNGSAILDGIVSPGTYPGGIETINFANAVFNGQIRMNVDATGELDRTDWITVGAATFGSSSTLLPVFDDIPQPGSINLIQQSSRSGTLQLDPSMQIRGLSLALQNTADEVNLNISGTAAPQDVVWSGDGSANAWNVNSTSNWAGGTFYQFDTVTFNDAGDNTQPISLTDTLFPRGVTVEGSKDYTFSGSGSIAGLPPLVKSGEGTLTLLNNNEFGAVTIQGGAVQVGNGGAEGSLGGEGLVTVAEGTVLRYNLSDHELLNRPFSEDSLGSLVKTGSGTLETSGGWLLLPNQVRVEEGTFRLTGSRWGATSDRRLAGEGSLLVEAGAHLHIPANNHHAFGSNNLGPRETVTIDGGTFTLDSDLYLSRFHLRNGALVNGSGSLRIAANNRNWTVSGTSPSTVDMVVSHVYEAIWTVEDVTGDAAPDLLFPKGLAGDAGFRKLGPGSVSISGASTYIGNTTVPEGAILLSGGNDRLPAATTVVLGNGETNGTLVLQGISQTVAGLSGATAEDAIVGGSAESSTLVVNTSGAVGYGGSLGGAGENENHLALIKSGPGTLTLTGDHSYEGETTVTEGSLRLKGTLAASDVTVTDRAALNGIGTVGGSLAIEAGATLAPGDPSPAVQGQLLLTIQTATGSEVSTTNDFSPFHTNADGENFIPENTTYIYSGEIYLPGATGTVYYFAENFDDSISLTLGGVSVLVANAYNVVATGSFTSEGPGWYPIQITAVQGGGGVGPVAANGWAAGKGFGFTTQEPEDLTNGEAYTAFTSENLEVAGIGIRTGEAIGDLAVGGDVTIAGTYQADVNGNVNDLLTVEGNLTLSPGSILEVRTLAGGAGLPVHVLATYSGTLSGTFATVNLPSGYSIDYAYNGNSIAISGTPIEGDAYTAWAAAQGVGAADADDDGDGLENAIEFVLGTNPRSAGHAKPLSLTVEEDAVVFSFRRTSDSESYAPYVEYSETLDDWAAVAVGGGVSIDDSETFTDGAVSGRVVKVTLPKSLAQGSRLFLRLRVDIP